MEKNGNNINMAMRLKIVEFFGTQEKLAAASGIDEAVISKIVRNVRKPTDEQKKTLIALLHSTEKALFDTN